MKIVNGHMNIGNGPICGVATVGEDGEVVLPARVREVGLDVGDHLVFTAGKTNWLPGTLLLVEREALRAWLQEMAEQLAALIENDFPESKGRTV